MVEEMESDNAHVPTQVAIKRGVVMILRAPKGSTRIVMNW